MIDYTEEDLKLVFQLGWNQRKENIPYKNPFDGESEDKLERVKAQLFSNGGHAADQFVKLLETLEY